MTASTQRGGFVLGMVVGLLVGLALALAVALYVTKVPVPFVDKVPQRSSEIDAAEAERLKRWDPNGPLAGKPAQRAEAPASQPSQEAPPRSAAPVTSASAPATPRTRDPAAILAGVAPSPAAPATVPGTDAFRYFVQVGAYSRSEDAEQQRARLAMLGFAARISERQQAGRTVYRVRLGPFELKDQADAAQERLKSNAVESALVRVER